MTQHLHVLSRSPESPRDQNQLLAALPAADFERLAYHLELVPLPLGTTLYEPGRRLQYAYFPTSCVVSLHYLMESGAAAEAAGVGNEGVVGISLSMGRDTAPNSAVVQTAGFGYRLAGRLLQREFDRAGAMQRLLLRYTQTLMAQMIQTAACNQHHMVEQKLSRFLLLTLDRVNSGKLVMTQERIGILLGVRRETVAEAAGKLQRAGAIRWHRGYIEILKRPALEAHACECYSVMKAELNCLQSNLRSPEEDLLSPDNDFLHAEESAADFIAATPAPLSNWQRGAEIAQSDARL